MADSAELDKAKVPDTPSAGTLLREARESAALSLGEVADRLHLLPKQLKALEADDYLQFNGIVFCKGYLRSYGKLLDIDAEILIEDYLQRCPESQSTSESRIKLDAQHIQRPVKGHSFQYWSFAVFIVIFVGLWLSDYDESDDQPLIESAAMPLASQLQSEPALPMPVITSNTVIGDSEKLAVEAEPVKEQKIAVIGSDAIIDSDSDSDVTIDSGVVMAADTSAAAIIKVENEQLLVVESALELKTQDLLFFHFSNDCWVKITDGDDKVLFSDLKRAQQSLSINGRAPFQVLLGYAPGVNLDYNGEPVSININRKNNSARLVVGKL